MKNRILFIAVFIIGLTAVFSFQIEKEVSPIQKIETKYFADYAEFRTAVSSFETELKNENGTTDDLKKQYTTMRIAFKKIEFIWAFLDREFVTQFINGAPLPKVLPNAAELTIVQPKGLQRIDEELFEDEVNRVALLDLITELKSNLPPTKESIGLRDQQFFDASKLAVVRLAYISSSGFDVPGSLNPFADMQASLSSLAFGFEMYAQAFAGDKKLYDACLKIKNSFLGAQNFIGAETNFETFDRVDFIRNYLNPLFVEVVKFHKLSGYETYYEVTNQHLGVNLLAENLINEQLLDKEFFFAFPADADSANLISLGKTLFYDPVLSASISVSCASCHNPKMAFSDGKTKSITHHGKDTVDRNAPGLLNAVYAEKYFYDLRTENLINQIEHVVISEKEMGTNPIDVGQKLNYSAGYKKLFQNAFGKEAITYQKVALALASYVSVLTDFDTEVDNYMVGKKEKISQLVYDGMNIFYGKGQCATCHFGPTYAGLVPPFYIESESEVLGVPNNADKKIAKADTDIGRFLNMKEQTDFYKFSHKTTTARNVKYTAPYMHNGVFETLEQLVDFYNDGGGNGWGFKLEHQTLASDELNLTDKEKTDLIAFLNALSSYVSKFEQPKSLPKFEGEFAKWNGRLMN